MTDEIFKILLNFVLAIRIFAIKAEMAYTRFSAVNFIFPQRTTKSFGTHVYNSNTLNNTSTKLQLQRIKLDVEIVNLKPVTPTTILLPQSGVPVFPDRVPKLNKLMLKIKQ